MTEEEFSKIMNARIDNLFDLYPIEDLRATETTENMKEGLGKSYAHKGMREYLENAVKVALRNMAIATTPLEIAYYKSRIDVLEQLLAKGKQVYTTVEISKSMRELQAKQAK